MAASLPAEVGWKVTAQDLTKDLDLSNEELLSLLELAEQVKAQPERFARTLTGRYLSLLFEKPSLRTRLTFELAIKQLGGDCVVSIGPVAEREPLKDVARNLDRWTQGIVARVFLQETIDELAKWSSVPVINALSDLYHPCQALADVLTIREHFGDVRGRKVAFVGDGNKRGPFADAEHDPAGNELHAGLPAELRAEAGSGFRCHGAGGGGGHHGRDYA